MSELPAWVDPAQMQLDTRFDAQGRWVSGPANDAAVPKPVAAQPRDIVVRDDTLRSGGNTPGVYASDFFMACLLLRVDSSRTTVWLYVLSNANYVTTEAGRLTLSHSV